MLGFYAEMSSLPPFNNFGFASVHFSGFASSKYQTLAPASAITVVSTFQIFTKYYFTRDVKYFVYVFRKMSNVKLK